ncbi:hypothetical protein CCO02nite_29930 [Cellulomonas composti]|uniref:DNA methylase adenine-specific domain-containing protein n=1 Tax=Cellulomonas composti TaxID=266130 RepID=A0A511JED7_9CELL|nr:hypothetical protein CCO02nite_29930 [Cellulomonas composti]
MYEYFLGQFASNEGMKAGEFYTPRSVVELLVEVLQPDNGRVLDPAYTSRPGALGDADWRRVGAQPSARCVLQLGPHPGGDQPCHEGRS